MFSFLKKKSLYNVPSTAAGWRILEPFAGAWQNNIEWKRDTVLAYHAVFACTTLIASDICKLRLKLMRDDNGIWSEIPLSGFPVIERPNNFQNRIQFFEQWLTSKLTRGNTYVLKGRDSRGMITSLHILSPDLVLPLVSDSGEVFYQLGQDNLTGVTSSGIVVPASEIIHDRFNCLYHPLVGLSPIYACGLAAYQGIKIQENSAKFFQNMSRPSGILTAPAAISDETANRLKESFSTNFSGDNIGKIAVLGDDLKYQPLSMTAEQAQMVEQLRLTAEIVCSAYHVPKYKVIGEPPSYNNIEALDVGYYSQCLQVLMESIELLLDKGFEMPDDKGFEFDLDGLLRMDSKAQVDKLVAAVSGGIDTPNEARKERNRKPLEGGDTVYLQQQQYSISALAERDKDKPFAKEQPKEPQMNSQDSNDDEEKQLLKLGLMFRKHMAEVKYDA